MLCPYCKVEFTSVTLGFNICIFCGEMTLVDSIEDPKPIRMQAVVGIMLDASRENILLLKKTHPSWQVGRFNGPGGKVELGETPLQAMHRECLEETSLDIQNWIEMVVVDYRRMCVHYFMTVAEIYKAISMTDESCFTFVTSSLNPAFMDNLHWIIPFCTHDGYNSPVPLHVTEIDTY